MPPRFEPERRFCPLALRLPPFLLFCDLVVRPTGFFAFAPERFPLERVRCFFDGAFFAREGFFRGFFADFFPRARTFAGFAFFAAFCTGLAARAPAVLLPALFPAIAPITPPTTAPTGPTCTENCHRGSTGGFLRDRRQLECLPMAVDSPQIDFLPVPYATPC